MPIKGLNDAVARCTLLNKVQAAGYGGRSAYDKKPQRYAEDNRTEFNTVRSGKCETEVNSNKSMHWRYIVLLKLRTQSIV